MVFRRDRPGKDRGGGVLLAVRPHLQPKRLDHLEEGAEIVWASVRTGNLRLLMGSAYRRPNASDEYNKALKKSLKCASQEQHNYDGVLLMGDFNLNVDWSTNPPTARDSWAEKFVDKFEVMSLAQLIMQPTRTTDNTEKN